MQRKFSEYYRVSEDDLEHHWQNDIFCFDANVLLNLYRYTPKTRKAFFDLLEQIENRIWITYQAAFEYQKNRLIVISAQKEAYKDIRETLLKKKTEIGGKLDEFKRHPYLQSSELKKQIESAFNSIGKDLDNLERQHPDYLENDPILQQLTLLLEGKVGDDFTKDDLERIYKDGKRRYEEKIPPGYMDAKKQNENNRSIYGDLIVWKQLITKAKDTEHSVILVTDDLKEDWWYKFKGKTIGPRPELIKEFREETNKRINIYRADTFLEMANKKLAQQTTTEAIQEIRDVRLADEREIDYKLATLAENTGDHAEKILETGVGINKIASSFEQAIKDSAETLPK